MEKYSYNDEFVLEIDLSIGGLLWYNVVDRRKTVALICLITCFALKTPFFKHVEKKQYEKLESLLRK